MGKKKRSKKNAKKQRRNCLQTSVSFQTISRRIRRDYQKIRRPPCALNYVGYGN